MKKKIIIIISIILIAIITLFLCNFKIEFDIPDKVSIIEYGQQIEKPKAYLTGRWFGKNIKELKVAPVIENDFSKIGDYENTYSAKFLFFTKTESLKVGVVDTKKPEIKLMYTNCIIKPGEEYVEEGYTAYDEYDGDLTSQVRVEKTKERWTYYVCDNSGNKTKVVRQIKYTDNTPPEIELIGDETIILKKGEEYVELGAKVIDDCDGDISSEIKISHQIFTDVKGEYFVSYTATDSFGNSTTIKRTVIVEKKVEKNNKIIYLTFDDGPSENTERLLKTLDKYNVKATFFVMGNTNKNHILKKIVDNGHTIGIHGITHDYSKLYSKDEDFIKQLLEMQAMIEKETGVKTFLMRFPGGSSNTVTKRYNEGVMSRLTKKVEELGFTYYDWNVSSGDGGGVYTTEKVYNNITKNVPKYESSIVLQHDTQTFSVDAVEDVIKWGLENGYTFKAIDKDTPIVHHGVNN